MTKSVKILCSGEDRVIDNFTHTIKIRGEESGAEIEDIKEKALPFNIDLPDDFSKASSDDEIDIGRKLDKANVLLSTLVLDNKTGFNNLNKDLNSGFNNLTDILGTFIKGQAEHNKRLEAILEKLVDKA